MALLMHCLYCVFVAWFFLQLYAFYGLETYFGCVILENSTVYEISNTSKYFEIQYSIRMIKERAIRRKISIIELLKYNLKLFPMNIYKCYA